MKSFEFNLAQLKAVAIALGDLLPQVTFVGGCTTMLLVDEAAYSSVRQTQDVDVIIDVTTYLEYQKFSEELRKRGFNEDTSGPNCRWLYKNAQSIIKLDVMPIEEKALGFCNRWYRDAMVNAFDYRLNQDLNIKVVNSVYFLATKFEAFNGRGKGDYAASHDLEDIVFVLEHRSDVVLEVMNAPPTLKSYFSTQAKTLLTDKFLNVLPGLLSAHTPPERVSNTLRIMASWPQE